jgi:AP-2 complex subunit alpha
MTVKSYQCVGVGDYAVTADYIFSPMVQFQLLHSKYPFCSQVTKGLLLSTYMKFINLFPEISPAIREVLQHDTQLRNSDPELQQRSLEYLKLSTVANRDVLATVLEEMPPFPERESTILAKLKKKGASAVVEKVGDEKPASEAAPPGASNGPVTIAQLASSSEQRAAEGNLITVSAPTQPVAPVTSGGDSMLVDTFAPQQAPAPVAAPATLPVNGPLTSPTVEESLQKFLFKNNGVLYESDVVQVGLKSEFRNNLGQN